MLKNLPPLFTPDALHALASMGHGDEVAVVDANFPAASVAARGGARLVRLPGVDSTEALKALLAVLPLDDFGPECAWTMAVVGDSGVVPAPVAEFRALLAAQAVPPAPALERQTFYERARQAYAIVQTGDRRKYANVLLRKGVLSTD